MPESGTYGSVRGAAGNSRPYRDCRPMAKLTTRSEGRCPKAAREGKRGKWGTRLSGRYGDLGGRCGAASTG